MIHFRKSFIRLVAIFTVGLCYGQPKMNSNFDGMLKDLLSHSVAKVTPAMITANDSIVILDAREKKEYTTSHIANAIWVGYDSFRWNRLKTIPKDKKVVVYCSVGYRSEKIAEKLIKVGYKDVSNLYGGIFEWVHQGNNVYSDQEIETNEVHTFDKEWSKWLTKGKKIY